MHVHSNGHVDYDVNLKNLNWVTASELAWHLHSGKVGTGASNASQGPAVACGPGFTAGHYDPWLKCGPASTGAICTNPSNGMPCCNKKPADDYCVNQNLGTCEVGDLSGQHGKLVVTNNQAAIQTSGLCPNCVTDYSPHSTATDGSAAFDTWASLVFHGTKDDPGERVLCADIKLVHRSKSGKRV